MRRTSEGIRNSEVAALGNLRGNNKDGPTTTSLSDEKSEPVVRGISKEKHVLGGN